MFFDSFVQMSYGAADVKIIASGAKEFINKVTFEAISCVSDRALLSFTLCISFGRPRACLKLWERCVSLTLRFSFRKILVIFLSICSEKKGILRYSQSLVSDLLLWQFGFLRDLFMSLLL